MNDIADVETDIASIQPELTPDQVAAVLVRADGYIRRALDLKKQLEAALLEYVQERGPIEIGTVRYYAGTKKTTKCKDVASCLESLLTACGGDLGLVAQALAAQPVKHGAASKILGDADYVRLFETVEEPDLKDGKPLKKLQRTDTRFLEGERKGARDTNEHATADAL